MTFVICGMKATSSMKAQRGWIMGILHGDFQLQALFFTFWPLMELFYTKKAFLRYCAL